jgi:hypothetical protein
MKDLLPKVPARIQLLAVLEGQQGLLQKRVPKPPGELQKKHP